MSEGVTAAVSFRNQTEQNTLRIGHGKQGIFSKVWNRETDWKENKVPVVQGISDADEPLQTKEALLNPCPLHKMNAKQIRKEVIIKIEHILVPCMHHLSFWHKALTF